MKITVDTKAPVTVFPSGIAVEDFLVIEEETAEGEVVT